MFAATLRRRAAVAIALGTISAVLTWTQRSPDVHSDLDEIVYSSRALLKGQNPYAVGDSLFRSGWEYPLIYPATAVVLAIPLAPLPLRVAQSVWNGLGAAGLAWVLTSLGWWGLISFAGAPFLQAYSYVQWSPMLVAGLAAPWCGFIWSAKPTIGAALFAGWPSRWALITGVMLVVLSFLLVPSWPSQMTTGLKAAPHIMPLIFRPGGFLLLLALLRWRRAEARMLGVLAIVPQTTAPYEMVPLFLIPRTGREMAWLTLLSQAAFLLVLTFRTGISSRHLAPTMASQWPFWLVLIYLPCLAMVLRRPNVAVPDQGPTPLPTSTNPGTR